MAVEPTDGEAAVVDVDAQLPADGAGAGGTGADGGDDDSGGGVDWGKYGRRPIILLAAVGFVDRVDKGILPGVVNLIQDELGFSDFQFGLLETAYVIAGLLIAVPAGYLADRRRRTRIVGVVLAGWAALSAATAAVQNYLQMFTVRAALGVGETVDDPASQSLLSDYYPAEIRGRAYAYQRVTPTVGTAMGLVLGSVVGSIFGWRAAFLIVGVPGSLLALAVWRLPEPERGESDRDPDAAPASAADHPAEGARRGDRTFDLIEMLHDARAALRVPSFRALFLGTAINSAALQALGFWGVAYYQRTSGLEEGTAGALAGGLILLGALGGSLGGGLYADRIRGRVPGAAMLLAAGTTALGAVLMFISFLEGIPVFTVRLPMQIVSVGLVVAALPATTAMTSEVVRPTLRSTAFSLIRFGSTTLGAVSPPLIGFLADQFDYTTAAGDVVGDLGRAFLFVIPFLLGGAYLYWTGRRHVSRDRAVALAFVDEGDGTPSSEVAATAAAVSPVEATAPLPAADGTAVTSRTDGAGVPAADDEDRTPGSDGTDAHGTLTRIMLWAGVALTVLGTVIVLLGWRGAAGTGRLFEQLPYLTSGGLLGTALLVLGALTLAGRWLVRRHDQRQRSRTALLRAAEDLRDALDRPRRSTTDDQPAPDEPEDPA